MAKTQLTRSPWRRVVGYPTQWHGVGMIFLGIVLGLVGGVQPWWWIISAIWLASGVTLLVVSTSDRRHSRGRYARSSSSAR